MQAQTRHELKKLSNVDLAQILVSNSHLTQDFGRTHVDMLETSADRSPVQPESLTKFASLGLYFVPPGISPSINSSRILVVMHRTTNPNIVPTEVGYW